MEHYDVKKIANTLIFFLDNSIQNLGITKVMKLFFYADKYHLEAYGKPIFNHTYTKLPRGPVPTWLYSIIRTSVSGSLDYDFELEVDVFNHYIDVQELENVGYRQIVFSKKQEFDADFFSKSQLRILQKVVSEFKNSTANQISEKSHTTKAWRSVGDNELISYASMIDEECVSSYVAYIQNEKNSFSKSFQKHKLKRAC